MSPPLLEARSLYKRFTSAGNGWLRMGKGVQALSDVSLRLDAGSTLAVVGESGSGKTTLARVLLGLLRPDRGSLFFNGREYTGLAAREGKAGRALLRPVQAVFQNPASSLNPRHRVGKIIADPMIYHGMFRRGSPALSRRMASLLEQVGLPHDVLAYWPHQLSGGQQQRAALARALGTEPALLICDEPVSALDPSEKARILNLLRHLNRDLGLACLFITHDLSVIGHLAERVLVMQAGRVVEQAPTWQIFNEPRHPATRVLLASCLTLPRTAWSSPPGNRDGATGP